MRIGVSSVCDKYFIYACAYNCRCGGSVDWNKKEKCACGSQYFNMLCAVPAFGCLLSGCQVNRPKMEHKNYYNEEVEYVFCA